ncbi:uncharacterized protein [Triticum aestivum]|uniref:uncharacterized protein n=1 Tax=Triticum aestivum TaxID=4565 RepID=UPI001D003A33|nr:uncharacterized protein LOC123147219 [Triticum aestivum]
MRQSFYNFGSAEQLDSELTSWHSEVNCLAGAAVVHPSFQRFHLLEFDEARHLAPLFSSPKDRLILPPHRRLFPASATAFSTPMALPRHHLFHRVCSGQTLAPPPLPDLACRYHW